MGDKEIMMAETSVDYKDENVTAACDTSGSIVHATENTTVPAPAAVFNTREMVPSAIGNVEGVPVNSQQTSSATAYSVGENFAAPESAFESTQGADYDSSLNSNGVREAGEGALTNISENGAAPAGGLSAEEERLWSIVTANSLDFSAWTALIEETERTPEGNIVKIRKVYDTFLAEFPLCYGYWKKYADHEAQLSSMDKVVEVYERAVQGVTYSVDMWLHYCVFVIGTYGDPETIKRFKELVASRPLSELRSSEEGAAESGVNSEAVNHENDGEILPNDTEQSTKAIKASLKDAEELEKYISIREEIYKKPKEIDSKIFAFETAIRRPYFHGRPLNVIELDNWHNYLNFIEGEGDLNKLIIIYHVICFIG